MRGHYSSRFASTRKTRLLTTTAMSMALAASFAMLHPSAVSAQAENLTFDDSDTTWDDSAQEFIDEDMNPTSFDDGDAVTFGSVSTLIRITESLRPSSITFDPNGGVSVLTTAVSNGNLNIDDNADFEVNAGDTLDFNVVDGTLELRVDVESTSSESEISQRTVRINAADGNVGEVATIEDFWANVEVHDGTLSLNEGLNEQNSLRTASVRGVLRIENGVVNNNNADVFGIARVGNTRAVGDLDPRTAILNHNTGATLRGSVEVNGEDVGETRVRDDGILNLNGGEFTDEDGDFDPNAEVNITGTGIVNVNEDTAVNIDNRSGTLNVGGPGASDPTAELSGDLLTGENSTTNIFSTIDGDADIDGGVVELNADGEITGLTTITDGTLNANGGDLSGGISAEGGNINITTSQTLPLTNEGSNITVEAGVTLGGAYTNDSGTLNVEDTATVTEEVVLDGGIVNANGGDFTNGLDLNGGTLNVNGDLALGAPLVNDDETDVIITNGGVLDTAMTNSGEDATLTVETGGEARQLVTLDDGTVTADGGTFTAGLDLNDGTLEVTDALTNDLTNDGSTTINVREDGVLSGAIANSGDGAIINNFTDGEINGQVTLSGDGVLNAEGGTFGAGGVLLQGGELNINADTALAVVNEGAQVNVNDTLQNGVTNNSGTLTNTDRIEGAVDLVDGRFEQDAGVVTGAVTVTDGRLVADGGTFEAGLDVNGGSVGITDEFTVTGDVTSNDADVSIATAGTLITDTLTFENGTLKIRGDLDGELAFVDGIGEVSGTVSGPVTQEDGKLTVLDGAQIESLARVNDGTLIARGGEFESEVEVETGGRMVITDSSTQSGDVTAVVRNQGGGVFIREDGNLIGVLENETGNTSMRGAITGDLNVSGGVVTARDSASVSQETNVSGAGELSVVNGTFTQRIRATAGGTVEARGNLIGDIENDGGTLVLGGDITGTVSNEDGTATSDADVIGALNLTGGDLTQTGGSFSMLATVDGGDLTATGGDFAAGIDALDGLVDINGDISASLLDIEGGDVDIASGAAMTGDVEFASGSLNLDGEIDGTLDIAGASTSAVVVTTSTTSSVTGVTTVASGRLDADGGTFEGGIVNDGGRVVVGDATTADITNNSGSFVLRSVASLDGDIANSASITQNGDVTGAVTNSGTYRANGDVTGAVSNTATYRADGDTTGDVTNSGTFAANGDITGNVTNTSTFTANGNTTGDVTNSGTFDANGDIIGDVANSGVFAADGVVTGAFENSGDGQFDVASAAEITDGLTNTDDGIVNIDGTLTADLENGADGTVNFDNATLDGGLFNFGEVNSDGTSFIIGDSINEGTINVNSGSLNFEGTFANNSPNTLNIEAGATFEADGLINGPDGRIVNAGTLLGDIINEGTIETNGGTFAGVLGNSGTITAEGSGTLSFGGGLDNTGLVDLTGDGGTNNVLSVGGAGLSGNGTYQLDIDLGTEAGGLGQSDYIIAEAGAPITGNLEFSFNVLAEGAELTEDIPILIVDSSAANDFTYSVENFPVDPNLTVFYGVVQDGANGDLFVADFINPTAGALAGTIVLTQSLIGSVINRPSSPFVNGLAYDDENPCGAGSWARVIGGTADATGDVEQTTADRTTSFEGEVSADYYGVQVGGDFACFNGYFNGWDLAAGAIAGLNQGSTSQPIFAIADGETGELSDNLISVQKTDFDQGYVGAYVTAVRNQFAAELQYRIEETAYTANNDADLFRLTDVEFSSQSNTLSGSVSYAIPIPETDITFVPNAGFAYTNIASDPIVFDVDGTIDIDDFTSEIIFAGGTVSRTKFGEDGTTALNQFLTATYYSDIAGDPTSQFTPSNSDGEVSDVSTANLGDYTELSAGVNYVKILEIGNGVNAKQLSASARADVRMSDQLESWGLTAQVRLQF